MKIHLRVVALASCALVALAAPGSGQVLLYSLFERYIDALRQQTSIPGMSALILRDGDIVWERGFGQQDIERNIFASPDTPYPVGGLTQTMATVLLGSCAERGRLDIDEGVSRWLPEFPVADATIRRVLAHASDSPARFRYDESRFAGLTNIAATCDGQAFRASLAESVLERLAMSTSVPGQDLSDPAHAARALFEAPRLARYDDVLSRVAVPYRVDRSGRATRSEYRARALTAADGLVSTVRDLARFDAALDDAVLLRTESLGVAWTPANFTGEALPTGLGWFIQTYQGERLIWHFSHLADAYSGLILKMPERRLTLIMLANSDGLSSGAALDQGDVTASPFVRIFLRLFVV